MRPFLALACVLVSSAPLTAQPAARPLESLLSADSLAYLRFDGIDPHRKAYEKTILHELLQEDLGEFLGYVTGLWTEILVEQAKNAANPAQQNALRFLSKPADLIKYAEQNGLAAGLEVTGHSPPRWQLTVVFPNAAAKNRPVVLAMLRLMAALAIEGELKETKQRGRAITEFHWDPIVQAEPAASSCKDDKPEPKKQNTGAWWIEGDHIVLILGSEGVNRTLDVCDGKRANLTATTLYKNLAAFNHYETFARGCLDLTKVVNLIGTAKPNEDAKKLLKETFARRLLIRRTGLDGLKSLSMHWGFEGRSQRSTVALGMVEARSRTGLLRLFSSGLDFDAKLLPSLPPDAVMVSAHSVDWDAVLDAGLQLARIAEFKQRVDAGEDTGVPSDFEDMVNKALTINLRDDLLDALGSTAVICKAPSDGPLFLGYSLALKVHDPRKVQQMLGKLIDPLKKYLADQGGGGEVKYQTSIYRGITIHTLTAKEVPLAPSYALHGDWLLVGFYPQTLRASLWRSTSQRASWQAPPQIKDAVAQSMKAGNAQSKLASVSTNNPAALLDRLLPLAPLFVQLVSRGAETEFDITRIPHTKAITERLFPNVTICIDDGTALRWESHASLPIPTGGLLFVPILAGAGSFAF